MHALSTLQSPHLSMTDSFSLWLRDSKGVDHFRFFCSLKSLLGQPIHFLVFKPMALHSSILSNSKHSLQPSCRLSMPHPSCNRKKIKTARLIYGSTGPPQESIQGEVSPYPFALHPLISPPFINVYSLSFLLHFSSTGSFLYICKHTHISFV